MSHKLISNDFIPILKKLCLNFGNNFDEVINLLFNEVNKIYGIDNLVFSEKFIILLSLRFIKVSVININPIGRNFIRLQLTMVQ